MLPLTCAVCLWPLPQSGWEGLNMPPQLFAKPAVVTSVKGADFSRPLEANNRDSQLLCYG